jgi:hypothetical protein
MIVADVRSTLTRDDAQFALRLIGEAGSDAAGVAETTLREQGIDAVLDDRRLVAALLHHASGAGASLRLFTYVVVRHACLAAGEPDRTLADYTASILLHFGLRDRARRIAAADDDTFDTLADIGALADAADARRGFLARQHLGNHALWVSGLFPDYVEHRRWRRGGPDLEYYEEMGRRGYEAAARHRLAHEHGIDSLLGRVAEHFLVLRLALNRVSDTVLFPHHHTPERLMRQVRDDVRWRRAG